MKVTEPTEPSAVHVAMALVQDMVVRQQVPLPSQGHLEVVLEAYTVQETAVVMAPKEATALAVQAATEVVQAPVLELD